MQGSPVHNFKICVAKRAADHIHMHNCYEPVWIMCPPPHPCIPPTRTDASLSLSHPQSPTRHKQTLPRPRFLSHALVNGFKICVIRMAADHMRLHNCWPACNIPPNNKNALMLPLPPSLTYCPIHHTSSLSLPSPTHTSSLSPSLVPSLFSWLMLANATYSV